ncbi:hypothetical protein M422DRAFT_44684 [Sphaerobolus stellatus SS14]|nr:hypothetical protein M422DRAFT_44684 [Sphaerobolus stellatus SS14]
MTQHAQFFSPSIPVGISESDFRVTIYKHKSALGSFAAACSSFINAVLWISLVPTRPMINELVEKTVATVDHPRDLFHMALAYKTFSNIIHRLEYRHITASFRREFLWKKLADQPLLAANVRSLVIQMNGVREVLPKEVREQLHASPLALTHFPVSLENVISYMHNISRFVWHSGGREISWNEITSLH